MPFDPYTPFCRALTPTNTPTTTAASHSQSTTDCVNTHLLACQPRHTPPPLSPTRNATTTVITHLLSAFTTNRHPCSMPSTTLYRPLSSSSLSICHGLPVDPVLLRAHCYRSSSRSSLIAIVHHHHRPSSPTSMVTIILATAHQPCR